MDARVVIASVCVADDGQHEHYVTDPLAGVTSCRPTMLYVATGKISVTQLAALLAGVAYTACVQRE